MNDDRSPNGDQNGAENGTSRQPVRVALVNDFELVVAGLRTMLEPFADRVEVVDESIGLEPVTHAVDVALFDTYGRSGPQPERVRDLVNEPAVEHVAIYSFDVRPEQMQAAFALGARGYLWKGQPAGQLVDELERVARGELVTSNGGPQRRKAGDATWPGRERGLSRRESEILALVVQGLSNREVGEALYLSSETVKTHLRGLFRKLGVNNRVKAVAIALSDPDFERRPNCPAIPG